VYTQISPAILIEPDDGILAIGSGGNYALSAGRALKTYAGENLSAIQVLPK
jgi:ATP-dependent HslUV protease subunit HslV